MACYVNPFAAAFDGYAICLNDRWPDLQIEFLEWPFYALWRHGMVVGIVIVGYSASSKQTCRGQDCHKMVGKV